jgi:hypothetical protein
VSSTNGRPMNPGRTLRTVSCAIYAQRGTRPSESTTCPAARRSRCTGTRRRAPGADPVGQAAGVARGDRCAVRRAPRLSAHRAVHRLAPPRCRNGPLGTRGLRGAHAAQAKPQGWARSRVHDPAIPRVRRDPRTPMRPGLGTPNTSSLPASAPSRVPSGGSAFAGSFVRRRLPRGRLVERGTLHARSRWGGDAQEVARRAGAVSGIAAQADVEMAL